MNNYIVSFGYSEAHLEIQADTYSVDSSGYIVFSNEGGEVVCVVNNTAWQWIKKVNKE